MKHKFQNPLLKHIVRELVRLDIEEAQAIDDECEKVEQGNAEASCEGCTGCQDTPEYLSVKEYAEDFGITLGTGAMLQMTNAAMKESVRQDEDVSTVEGTYVFHPDVLEKVFAPLLKMMNRV